MAVSKTKLSTTNSVLAKKIDILLEKGSKLGIRTGVQRIELICEQYDKVAPDVALTMIDLDALQQEIEEAQFHRWKIQLAHGLRNFLGLAPLIATWFALFWAVGGYQHNLQLHPTDNTVPFLQQWQEGFRHTTWFTFTTAALLDVCLLCAYLGFVIGVQVLEGRARRIAVEFIDEFNICIDELISTISAVSFSPITGPEDIDKVAKAVTSVVQYAITETDKLTKAAQKAVDSSNDRVTDLFTKQVVPLFGVFETNMKDFRATLTTFEIDLRKLNTSVNQLASDSSTMATHAQSYLTLGQNMNTHLGNLNSTEQGLVSQLSGFSGNVSAALGSLQTAATGMQIATNGVEKASTHLDNGIQVTMTKMTDSVDRATTFQGELSNFLIKLDSLNLVTQSLTNTSGTLAAQVQTMGSEVKALQTSQQQVSNQLTNVVGHIANAANNMATATTSIENVANSLNVGLNQTVHQMTQNIDRSTRALGQVENSLSVLVPAMAQAATQFASFSPAMVNNSRRSGGGGFVGWLLRRGGF
jgi:hypothetical protein